MPCRLHRAAWPWPDGPPARRDTDWDLAPHPGDGTTHVYTCDVFDGIKPYKTIKNRWTMVKLLRSSVELNSCIVVVFDRLNRSYLTLKSVDVKALPGGSNWTHGVSAKALRHEHPMPCDSKGPKTPGDPSAIFGNTKITKCSLLAASSSSTFKTFPQ